MGMSTSSAGRGRFEIKKPVYADNPYLPSKIAESTRMKPSVRKELKDLDKELDDIKMTLANLQNLEINKMLSRELEIHCRTVEEKENPETVEKSVTPVPFNPVDDMAYFYFWTVEGHFFGLLENANQIRDDECTKYALRGIEEFDGIQDRIGYCANNYRYSQTVIKAKWKQNEPDFNKTFFGTYFDNILIRISSIWISQTSGMIFVHFCPTFRISLVLQLSIESSQVCSVETDESGNVPSFLSKDKNIFLIKIPMSTTSDLKLYANVKSDDIGDIDHREKWRKNPVTSVIVNTVHPD